MAGKTVEITLGGSKFTIKKFNIGEMEKISAIVDDADTKRAGFKIIRLAFERAEPKIDIDTIEADASEIADAIKAIMILAGLRTTDVPLEPAAEQPQAA